jgi:hypothetical protein
MKQDIRMKHSPIFIGGLDRSGKTYMRFMLAAHPSIAISKRTNLWPRYYKRFGNLENNDNLNRCLGAFKENKHIQNLNPDFKRLRRDFLLGPQTYERLFSLIHIQYAGRLGKKRWGDQTELLEKYALPILTAYPQARFIHMMRDPRDRYEAVLQKSHRSGGVGVATARWLYSAALAKHNQQVFPQHYRVIHYETMVASPEETMQQVCKFIGEDYHQDMIQMRNIARFAKTIDQNGGSSPLSMDYIGRFRKNLPAHEIFFIQRISRRYMKYFNYPSESVKISLPGSALIFPIHWFINSAWMAAWKIRNLAVR